MLAMYSDGLNLQYFQDPGATRRLDLDFEFAEISGLLAKRASLEEQFRLLSNGDGFGWWGGSTGSGPR